jgi:response regulator RpfG family c-di-GMP phosphodiesterase
MSRIRAWLVLALIVGQGLALLTGSLIYENPVTSPVIREGWFHQNRAWIVGIMLGVLAALWTAMVARLVLQGCEGGFAKVKAQLDMELSRQFSDLMATRNAVIFGMARLSESRDVTTGQHLLRIRQYVEALARQLRNDWPKLRSFMNDAWIADLGLSSALHDIGKVGIPDSILLKPGKLSPKEQEEIRKHTWIGGDCLYAIEQQLGSSNFLNLGREIAYAHHEWWNGEGYPFGLKGENIPFAARIVAIADVYDALTTARPYKPALTHESAVGIITKRRGTQFDPKVVDSFMSIEKQFDAMRRSLAREDSPRVHAEAA